MAVKDLSPVAMDVLVRFDWPGNVREVGNVIQRACVLGLGPVIEVEDLSEALLDDAHQGEGAFLTLQELIRSHIGEALERSGGVRIRAAEMLGVNRKHLWRMMRRHHIS